MPTAILVEENITRESGGVLSVPIQNASRAAGGLWAKASAASDPRPDAERRRECGVGRWNKKYRACAHFFLPMPRRAGVSKMGRQMMQQFEGATLNIHDLWVISLTGLFMPSMITNKVA